MRSLLRAFSHLETRGRARVLLVAALAVGVLGVSAGAADWSVTDFGAVADGKTDCTRAIQDALNAAGKAGGGRVVIPAAELPYRVCSTIRIAYSKVELAGDGATLQLADDAVKNSRSHVLVVSGNKTAPIKDVVVRGLTIDANYWNQKGALEKKMKPRGLIATYVENLLVDRVHVRRAWVSLAFQGGTKDCEARDCVVSQWHNDGFDAAYDATDIRFVRCCARDAMSARAGGLPGGRDGAWEIEDGVRNITLTDCVVEKTDCSAFKLRSHNTPTVNRNVRFIRCRALAPCRRGWIIQGRDHDTRTEGVLLEDCEGAGDNRIQDGADQVRIEGGRFASLKVLYPRGVHILNATFQSLLIQVGEKSDGKETYRPDVVLEGVKVLSGRARILGDRTMVKIREGEEE